MKDSGPTPENQRGRLAVAAGIGLAAVALAHPALVPRAAVFGAVTAGLALAAAVGSRDRLPPWPLTLAALLWLVALGLSAAVTGGRLTALTAPVSGLALAGVGWSLGRHPAGLERLVPAVTVGAVVVALATLGQHAGLDPLPRVDVFTDRVVGPFLNPNHLGSFAAAVLPLLLGAHLAALRPDGRRSAAVLWGAVTVLVYAALLLAGSRGGFYAAAAGGLCVGLGAWRLRRRRGLRLRPLGLVGLPLAMALTTVALQHRPVLVGREGVVSVGARLQAMSHIAGDAARNDATVLHRRVLWRTALQLFSEHPLLGVGPGNFADAATTRVAAVAALEGAPAHLGLREHIPDYAHNELLHAAAETGLAGALPVLALTVMGLGWAATQAWRRPRLATWAALGACAAVQVDGLVSYPSHMDATAGLYWILFGVAIRMAGNRRDDTAREETVGP